MTQAAGGEAEVIKTATGRGSVKLLRSALDALRTQKNVRSWPTMKFPELAHVAALDWRSQDPAASRDEESRLSLSMSLSDITYLRPDDASACGHPMW
jgi:hypothetical protein